nr:transposase [Mesorhizobium delmotii]
MLAKLSAFPRQNGLALALRDIGRINRSIFLPQWWQNPEMRRNATAGKSEAQKTLARALFFNRHGELRDRTFESQFYRASGLNLLINAIVYWDTLYLEPTFAELKSRRHCDASRRDQAHHAARMAAYQPHRRYIWTPTDSLDLRPLRRETSMLAA